MASQKDGGISWTDETWNPVTGCNPVSEGCRNCYAARYAKRGIGDFRVPPDRLVPRPFSEVRTHPDRLEQPLHWKKPRMVFVCSMGDLFHEDVPDEFIDKVFAVMALSPQHTFQLLTKRPARMKQLLTDSYIMDRIWSQALNFCPLEKMGPGNDPGWPLPNVWLGVTAENQDTADERIPLLLHTPAAVRFVSCEPLLSDIDLLSYLNDWPSDYRDPEQIRHGFKRLSWLIVGGETGPGARPMHPDWVQSLRDQAVAAGVPFHFKQWGEWHPITFDNRHGSYGGDSRIPNKRKIWVNPDGSFIDQGEDGAQDYCWGMVRVGKKKAGRILDGREWLQFPEVRP